ncbi:alcohol dehydrogenase-like protein [Dichotomopilus funicola]|uniref:Alcohol dehydrogenase-like protein n=1 Tax=Dichotomopilus funicola TaxID=1934379 RepID=A0AAN6UW99_9PEZI|nr:alcohol dehydrogenase-like protein [Dichotomopilus funicola]
MLNATWYGHLGGATNQGDDIAGIVEKVGANVYEFRPGDRVGAFHEMLTPHGSYAEYAIAWQHMTFHIPNETTFEEAATIPLAAMTAAVALYLRLSLPSPWSATAEQQPPTSTTPTPLIIYGASSAVGIYATQLALRSGIHPLLCVAGRASDYVAGFLDSSRGDVVVDYRQGDEKVVEGLVRELEKYRGDGGGDVVPVLVLDAVSEGGTIKNIGRVLERVGGGSVEGSKGKGKVTLVLSGADEKLPEGVERSNTSVGQVHKAAKDFGFVYFRYFARGLREGWFKPQRFEVVPGGLAGIQGALEKLKDGKASAVKYVFRIGETER